MKIRSTGMWMVWCAALFFSMGTPRAQSGDNQQEAIGLGVLDRELVSAAGSVGAARPEIWYKFEILQQTREVVVGLSGGIGELGLFLGRDADNNGVLEQLGYVSRLSAASGVFSKLWLDPGIYHVRVEMYNSTAYELRLTSTAKATRGETDNSHILAVDLGEAREPLTYGDWVGISDPEDWYKFEIKSGTREVVVGLSGGVGELGVFLGRDADNNGVLEQLGYNSRLSADSGAFPKLWLDPGIYYVRVETYNWTEYVLRVTSTPKDTRGETDNSHTLAVDLGEAREPLTYGDWVGISDPDDWYKFEIKPGTREVVVGLSGGIGELGVFLGRDANNDGVLEQLGYNSRLSADSGAFPKLWLDPGIYYVRVETYNWTEYMLRVTSTPKDTRGETDNSHTLAVALGAVRAPLAYDDWVGISDPIDWYRFEVAGSSREVVVGLSGGIGELGLYLGRDANNDGVVEQLVGASRVSAVSGALAKQLLPQGTYYVVVNDYNWSEYTLNINQTLPPNTKPFIDVQPASQTVTEGRSVSLRVLAEGSGTLSYQWFRDGQPLDGQTASELLFPSIPLTAQGNYTVKITNAHGEVTSAVAELIVNPAGFELNIDPAVILSWPASAGEVILEGSDAPAVANSWKTIPYEAITVGDRKEVAARTLGGMKAYRLRKP